MSALDIPALPALPEGVDPYLVTRELAAAFHPQVVKELARRGLDSTISTTSLISISEHLYKVSGLSARQEVKPAAPGFSIQIILGDTPETRKTITIGEAPVPLGEVPTYMLSPTGNLEGVV
jgi:hypothetical protein